MAECRQSLNFRRAAFGLLKEMVGLIPWEMALKVERT